MRVWPLPLPPLPPLPPLHPPANSPGTFQDQANQKECKKHAVCPKGEEVDKDPTPTSDRVCKKCSTGFFKDEAGQQKCEAVTVCPAGTFQSKAPTASTDTVCTPCTLLQTWQDKKGQVRISRRPYP